MPRTLLKTCTYCLMHFTVAIIVAYALTRSWKLALAVGIVEPLVQTFTFALHEKAWSKAPERIGGSVWSRVRLWPRRPDPEEGAPAPSSFGMRRSLPM